MSVTEQPVATAPARAHILGRVEAVGRSVPTIGREFGAYLARTATPPLLVSGFNMSSVSPAS